MTTITNKSKTLSGITRALGIMTVIGVGAIATAGTADAGGKHHHKRHWNGGHGGGIHFGFYPRYRHYDRAYYKGGDRNCHNHRWGKRGMRNHKRIRCHFHRRWRDDSIRYVR